MRSTPEEEALLNAVIAEIASDGFEEVLVRETMRAATRRRRVRTLARAGASLAMGLALAVGTWQWMTGRPRDVIDGGTAFHLERTSPLPIGAVVRSTPFGGVVTALGPGVTVVRTEPAARLYHEIGDPELLAAVSPRSAVLITVAPSRKKLVFAASP